MDLDAPGGGAYGIGDDVGCGPGRGFVVGSGRSVEADDGMDVDGRPFLVFGDAGEGQSGVLGEAGLYEAGGGGEAPPDVDDEPVPQLGSVRVPEGVAGVVVAGRAERLADSRGVLGVDGAAAEGTSVFAGGAVTAGAADVPCPVDRSEGRSGERDEEPGAVADCIGDALAAEQARADEVVSVSGVKAGAGGADGCAAVAAADEEAFAGFVAGVVVADDLASRAVQGCGRAGEMDGVRASAGGGDLLQPAGELRILGEADGVAVGFGELAQARRAVEGSAPVSRRVVRGDGGDLPGWAAAAARVRWGGVLWVMGITPLRGSGGGEGVSGWCRCPGRRGSAGCVRSRSYGRRRPCSTGTSHEAWA